VSTTDLIDVSAPRLAAEDSGSLPLCGRDFTKIVLKAAEPLTLVRPNGKTVTVPNSFLLDVTPVEKAYISSGDHSSLSIGELKIAKNPRRLRTQTDQNIDFDQKNQICHFKKIISNRCVTVSPEYLSKNTGARYDRVMKEKEASALMEQDEAIDHIGGVDAESPVSARQKRENMVGKEEKKRAFEALLSRLSRSGTPPEVDSSKAAQRSDTRPLRLHYKRPSDHSNMSTVDITPPPSAYGDKDSGYDTESPVKKLNPAASKFKSAPTAFQGGMKTHVPPHVNLVFPHGHMPAPIPMPAGLPPMKPFGMPFDADKGVSSSGVGQHPFKPQVEGHSNLFTPDNPVSMPPPQWSGMQNPMFFQPMPPFPPLGLLDSFDGMPPNMLPPFPPMPPLPMELPRFNNGNHFNTFPHCGPPPSLEQFLHNTAIVPPMPPNLPIPSMRPAGPTILPSTPFVPPHNNNNNNNNNHNVNPVPAITPKIAVAAGAPPPPPAIVVPPHFPVTKKPRDNDPYKQQKYEEYLEWRKMYEPGFHLAAKQRQQNRVMRQRGQSRSEGFFQPPSSSSTGAVVMSGPRGAHKSVGQDTVVSKTTAVPAVERCRCREKVMSEGAAAAGSEQQVSDAGNV
jgi:hypothetical protein